MGSKINLTGHKYTRLLVLEESEKRIKNQVTWVCKCDCGKVVKKTTRQLRTENNKSCGCLQSENARKIGLKNRKSKGQNGLNSLFRSYKTNAKNKKIPFEISIEEFSFFTKLPCFYCGKLPSQIKTNSRTKEGEKHSQYIYNGIDRVNSDLGYIGGNILPCCKDCNYAKRNMSITEFINWTNNVHNNFTWRFKCQK
jgi:hypothetical protein